MKTTTKFLSTAKAGACKAARAAAVAGHALTFILFATFITTLMYISPAKQVVEMIPAQPGMGICMPSSANNYCAPDADKDTRVAKVVKELEAKGMKCTSESRLADTIVFQFKSDEHVEAVSFDEAFTLGKKNLGWAQKFCS